MESSHQHREPCNKGKLIGQKPPLKLKDIWAIRIHLQNTHQVRDLAMFNLAIDSKLRGCDLVNLLGPGTNRKYRSCDAGLSQTCRQFESDIA